MSQYDVEVIICRPLTTVSPVLFIRAYSLKRTVVRNTDAKDDLENGKTDNLAVDNALVEDDDEKQSIREILRADANEIVEVVKYDIATEETHLDDLPEMAKIKV
jgi:hypothetical protein